ncbi:MAG: pitrilysin family protein [Bacillota bacterium]|nr:pitrilysin family protein [Bacillota bacterium]
MYQKTTLDNGIRVVTEHLPHVRSVALGFWFGVGARHEDAGTSGLSHLIEHLMFKGTAKRSARQIAEEFDATGGQLNAYTSKEYTCYYARVLDRHLPMATEVLADMVLHSRFAPEDLEKEKGVVQEEIKMYEDSPDEMVHDLFTQAILGGHPLGRTILGTAETVSRFTREDLLTHLERHYTPDNLVVAAAGHAEHAAVVAEVECHFRDFRGRRTAEEAPAPAASPKPVLRAKETEQVHLCLGVEGLKRGDPRKYALFTLDVILGGGMSSRLFQELREERGLVYSTYSYHVCYRETGLFAIYAGMSPHNADEVVDLVKREFARLAAEGVGAEELRRAKEQLKGSLVLSLESTASRMSRIAKSELFDERYDTPDELVAKVDAVTAADVNALAAELLAEPRVALAAIGPWGPGAKGAEGSEGAPAGGAAPSR